MPGSFAALVITPIKGEIAATLGYAAAALASGVLFGMPVWHVEI